MPVDASWWEWRSVLGFEPLCKPGIRSGVRAPGAARAARRYAGSRGMRSGTDLCLRGADSYGANVRAIRARANCQQFARRRLDAPGGGKEAE